MEGGERVKLAKIGRAIMDADIVISLNHFKGHESTGFGGAIKKLGDGQRQPGRQNGAAQCRQTPGGSDLVPGLPRLRKSLRPERHRLWRRRQSADRPWALRGLRALPCTLQLRCHQNEDYNANDELNRRMAEYAKSGGAAPA